MKKNYYPGKFLVFEGLDGSGLSTQSNLLKDFLIKKGYQVVLTKEPTFDSEAGKRIRKVLDNKEIQEEPKKLQELFAKDRKEHLENLIIPALKEGKIVISDRYLFSSLAYGSASGLDFEWLIKINDNFPLPDITFLLKVSPEICLERIKKRNSERTLFEKKEKFIKAWQIFKTLPGRFENIYLIDGEKPIEEVFEDVKKIINQKINL